MKIKFFIIILFLSVLLPASYSLDAKTHNMKKIENKKPDEKMMQDIILKNKFANMPNNPAYIVVKVKTDKERMDLVCRNDEWMKVCIDYLKLAKSPSEYSDYMINNHDKIFEVSGELYNDLKKYKAGDFYVNKYKTQEDFKKALQAGEFANTTEQQLLKDRAFLKMMLKFVPLIRININDGSIGADNSYK